MTRPLHVALAVLVAVIWGVAFVATKIALESFSPPQLTALRFLIAAIPVAFLPRPPIPLATLVGIGLALFTGQFLLQFFGIARGTPAGLAAVLVQSQALFTVLFAAVALGERPPRRQLVGIGLAAVGVLLIGLTVGDGLTLDGFALTLGAAVSWGVGNIFLKRVGRVEMLPLIVWLSLVPPLPALALSIALDGPTGLLDAVATSSGLGLAATLYLGLVATILAYAIWGTLLQRYPAATVAPFALLVPFVGALASSIVLGERFGSLRLAGMTLVLIGLAVIALKPASA